MYMKMKIHFTPLAKVLNTHITDVKTLCNLYMSMSIQDTPFCRGITTHIADVRTLSSMYLTMSTQYLLWAKELPHSLQM
jgi:hypothetical protein